MAFSEMWATKGRKREETLQLLSGSAPLFLFAFDPGHSFYFDGKSSYSTLQDRTCVGPWTYFVKFRKTKKRKKNPVLLSAVFLWPARLSRRTTGNNREGPCGASHRTWSVYAGTREFKSRGKSGSVLDGNSITVLFSRFHRQYSLYAFGLFFRP